MSYTNGTTHYNLPQTVGNDKRDWFDTNQAFADVDSALYGAVQQSTATAGTLETLVDRVTTVEGKQATDEQTITEHGTAIGALQTTVNQHTSAIADVRQDAEDMISAYNEGAAETSTHAYAVGDYFIYNDVLYRATQVIAIGDTIVPNTNCEATNVTTEVSEIKSAVDDKLDAVSSFSGKVTVVGSAISTTAVYCPMPFLSVLKALGYTISNMTVSSAKITGLTGDYAGFASIGDDAINLSNLQQTVTLNASYIVEFTFTCDLA